MKNNLINIFGCIFLILLITTEGRSQFVLDSIFIQDSIRHPFKLIKSDQRYDDAYQFSATDFLASTISGQVQYSTPGGLTTFLHRGMGNRHLPVLWNGTNIQSVINGSYDLSLIPVNLYNGLQFYTTGNPALSGNNGVSGTLDIKSNKNRTPLEITTSISTLQNYTMSVRSEMNKNKYSGYTGIEYGYDRNVFKYKDDKLTLQRTPTDLNKLNIVYQGNYFANQKQMIYIDLWYQNANRNIPVSTTSAYIDQHQIDNNLRIKAGFVQLLPRYKISSGITFMDEQLDFMTPAVNSISNVKVYIATLEISEIGDKNYFASVNWRKDLAHPNFYSEIKSRNTWQIALGKHIKKGDYTGSFSVRQDLTDNKMMPFSFSFLNIFKKSSLQISKNYSLPGFNDLYWPSGGNESLKTEKSIQAEFKSQAQYKKFLFTVSVYVNHVNDWIQWIPQASGLWSAVNQKKVLSRGMEGCIGKSFISNRWIITPDIAYSFTKTTALDHYFDKNQIGKPLIYIPQHKVITSVKFVKDGHHLRLSYHLTGKRYDTTDQSNALPVIHLTDISYSYVQKKYKLNLGINNLLNQQYNIIRYFPMPGINAEMKWTFSII